MSRGGHVGSEAGRPGGGSIGHGYKTCYSDVPPVHVAADHEVGGAVPEVDAGEVAQRVAQLREAAFCFQAVDQDLGRRNTRVPLRPAVLHPHALFPHFQAASPQPLGKTLCHSTP